MALPFPLLGLLHTLGSASSLLKVYSGVARAILGPLRGPEAVPTSVFCTCAANSTNREAAD